MLQKILCFFGFHDWDYTPAVYLDEQSERLAIPLEEGKRTCKCCDTTELEDRHCLGLNPPEYVVSWYRAPN